MCCHRCKNCVLLLEAVALTGSVATEPVRVGGVCLHFYMGLNHYIGSLLNYRLLFLSQRHHAIFEAMLCSRVRFWLLLFFLVDVPLYCIYPRQYAL